MNFKCITKNEFFVLTSVKSNIGDLIWFYLVVESQCHETYLY